MNPFRHICKAMGPLVLVGITTAAVVPAHAGINDPLVLLYLFPGARDNGGADFTGVASAVHCMNFSGATEKIQWVTKNFNAVTTAGKTFIINNEETRTAVTHRILGIAEDVDLVSGVLDQGVIGVAATSTSMVCSAQVLAASVANPTGHDLHAIRYQGFPGSQE
jgi:hypothetical protein